MRIIIETIPHNAQRYETVGDWEFTSGEGGGTLLVKVSDLYDYRKEFLVGMHECIEAMLCLMRGISEDSVTAFDIDYETNRTEEDTTSEPGDCDLAPYHKEHVFATNIERLLCAEMGINWSEYEEVIHHL